LLWDDDGDRGGGHGEGEKKSGVGKEMVMMMEEVVAKIA
jgi:hypothetical protein